METTTPARDDRGERVCEQTGDGWQPLEHDRGPGGGARWVVVQEPGRLVDAARRYGLGEGVVAALEHRGASAHPVSPSLPMRARVDRTLGGELVLTVPTLSYVEQTRDVRTGALTCVVGPDVLLMCELGDAQVIEHAEHKLTSGTAVPDRGVQQVLAAVLLTLVATASEVEIALGEATAETERVVFSSDGRTRSVEQIYDLKREIAEARHALGPVTTVLPDLLAEEEEASGGAAAPPWLRRLQASTDRVDRHLDAHDRLLGDMLSAHLAQVSVQQNEDMRKISAWAAMIAVPTLVAGVYGMNFRHMPELDWTYGYPAALVGMAVACWVLFRVFRRSGWL
ncbi:magnesium and cobalt transport protein CorA [Cellulomonas sp. URHB0016]